MYKMIENQDIIIISNQMLNDHYWTSKQYITMELIKNYRVLYVEANYSFGKMLTGLMGKKWPVTPFGKLYIKNQNLSILTPYPRLPFRNHFRWIGWLNQKLLLKKIRSTIKKLNYKNPILWTFLHQTADLVGKLKESISIYHCVDDWPILLSMANMGRTNRIREDEIALTSSVDIIFRVSSNLLSRLKIPNPILFDMPNGVDIDLFNPRQYSDDLVKHDMKNLSRPIIGFSGTIGKWIDIELIIQIAKCYKNGSIVLIGLNENNPNIDKLQNLNNIYFLGMKSREEVPEYISNFDVCLMPFNRTKIGEGLLPLKMFEYLALGKPVVATSSKVLKQFSDVLYLANDTDTFLEHIKNAITNHNSEYSDFRRDYVLKYSWGNRVNDYLSKIQEFINRK